MINTEQNEIEELISSEEFFKPVRKHSNRIQLDSEEDYRTLYERSVNNIGEYWSSVASELEWFKQWSTPLEGDLGGFKFFINGYTNVSFNCIDRHAKRDPQKTAIIWLSEDGLRQSVTYSELMVLTAKFAKGLIEEGVREGDVVAIYLPNRIETFIAAHACFRIGAIYNIIFSGFSAKALLDRIKETNPKVVITADSTVRRGRKINLKETLDSILGEVPSVKRVIVVKRDGKHDLKMGKNDIYYDDFMSKITGCSDPVPIEANTPGFVIYTSGTTAKPKGVVHSGIGFLVGAYHNVKYALDLGPDDVYWCTADVGWLTFPIFELVGGLAHGATVVAYEGALDFPDIGNFYRIMQELKITKLFTAPTFLRMLARNGSDVASRYDLSNLKLISLVGEPLDVKTWKWVFNDFGRGKIEINNTYGQTETGSAWTSSLVGVTSARPGSCGLPLPGHAFDIVDDTGKSVGDEKIGTLIIKKPFPTLARSVWKDAQRYHKEYLSVFPGNYCTYDSAVRDKYGHIWVLGRTDDVINVSGHRISTMEMEDAIMSIEEVSDAAVVGIDHEIKGMSTVAFVTLSNNANLRANLGKRVQDEIVRRIGNYARPESVYIIPEMPKTRSGKIMRRLLREIITKGKVTGDLTGLEDPGVISRIVNEIKPS